MSDVIEKYRLACSHYEALRERCTDDDKVNAAGRQHMNLWANMSKYHRSLVIRDNVKRRNPAAFTEPPDDGDDMPPAPGCPPVADKD